MSDISLDQLRALQDDLRALGRAETDVVPPARLRDEVLAAWDAAHPSAGEAAATPHPRRLWWATGVAVAAAAVLAFVLWPRPHINPGLISPAREINPGLISQAAPAGAATVVPSAAVLAPIAAAAPTVPAPRAVSARRAQSRATASTSADAAQWVVIGQPIADDERIAVVRVRMTAANLGALGLGYRAGTSDTVDVDLLVGEDGVTRGVRMW